MGFEPNPYTKLVRLIEQRLKRQQDAVVETEQQLVGARESEAAWSASRLKDSSADGRRK